MLNSIFSNNCVPANQRVFVNWAFVEKACLSYRLNEAEFFALERLVEGILDRSMPLHLLHEKMDLPPPITIVSTIPVVLPVVKLAIAVGKCCPPQAVVQRGKPWSDPYSAGLWRFDRSDVVWLVRRLAAEENTGRSGRLPRQEYLLHLWISVFEGGEEPLMGILEQSVLFDHPEAYLRYRYGITVPRQIGKDAPVLEQRRDGRRRLLPCSSRAIALVQEN